MTVWTHFASLHLPVAYPATYTIIIAIIIVSPLYKVFYLREVDRTPP